MLFDLLHAHMPFLVDPEVGRVCEGFAANRAAVWPLPGVCSLVHFEALYGVESRFATSGARKFFFWGC